jgi:hypothetical protein
MGGKCLLTLNTPEIPIANKYREGKLQSTLKRECKVPETCAVEGMAADALVTRMGFGWKVPLTVLLNSTAWCPKASSWGTLVAFTVRLGFSMSHFHVGKPGHGPN